MQLLFAYWASFFSETPKPKKLFCYRGQHASTSHDSLRTGAVTSQRLKIAPIKTNAHVTTGTARLWNRVLNWKHLRIYLSQQSHQSAATGDFQFAEDGMKMSFHRFKTQTSFIGNLLIAKPIAYQTCQILFSAGKAHEVR